MFESCWISCFVFALRVDVEALFVFIVAHLHKSQVKLIIFESNQLVLCPPQVRQPLRPQRRRQQPLSPEANQTTALPGQSTTVSRPLTTAQPTLSRWVQLLKPLRYTPDKNLLAHPLNTQFFVEQTFLPQVSQALQWSSSFTHLTKTLFPHTQAFNFLFWEAESTVSAVNMQCIFYVFLCTGPVMWSGHKVNTTLSKQNPLFNVWMQTPWWRS